MFLEKFCQTFNLDIKKLNINNLQGSKYDFCFYYIDNDGDKVIVANNGDFNIFYEDVYSNKEKSTTKHLFFKKKEDNNKIKAYDNIIKNENFKNISITVYINEDFKANNEEEKKEENNHIENNLNGKGDKKDNVNKNKNNDCSCYKCCLDCCNWFTAKALYCLPN